MKNHDPRQLELFSDGARAVAARKRPQPPNPTEADLRSKLDAARMRLRELVVFGMKTWLPAATLPSLRRSLAASRSNGLEVRADLSDRPNPTPASPRDERAGPLDPIMLAKIRAPSAIA
jgi:hypothetical protein